MCVCELFTTLPRPQTWAVKLKSVGPGTQTGPERKRSLKALPPPPPRLPGPGFSGSPAGQANLGLAELGAWGRGEYLVIPKADIRNRF